MRRLVVFNLFVLALFGCGQKDTAGPRPVATQDERTGAAPAVRSEATKAEATPSMEADFAGAMPASEPAVRTYTADSATRPLESRPSKSRLEEHAPQPLPEPADRQPPQPQAGLLTAGSLDDHAQFDAYRDYLSSALQNGNGRLAPEFSIGRRVVVEVRDAQGRGVGNAKVTVRTDANSPPVLTTYTRSNGCTFFATGLDARDVATEEFLLTVEPPGSGIAERQVSLAQTSWTVDLPDTTAQLPQQLDLALVIDTTGSMGDELEYLKAEIAGIVESIRQKFPQVSQRFALILYRDEHDEYVTRTFDFVDSLDEFCRNLSDQSAHGGGDHPEAVHRAVQSAGDLSWRTGHTARMVFLVADAPPHSRHIGRTFEAARHLHSRGVAVYPLAGSGTRDECEFLFRATAFMTGGQYLFLTDHSGVGNPQAKPHSPRYDVEPLNQLMTRLIAAELAGKQVLAQDIIATESGDGTDPQWPPEQNQRLETPQTVTALVPDPQPASRKASWTPSVFRIIVGAVAIALILFLDKQLRT